MRANGTAYALASQAPESQTPRYPKGSSSHLQRPDDARHDAQHAGVRAAGAGLGLGRLREQAAVAGACARWQPPCHAKRRLAALAPWQALSWSKSCIAPLSNCCLRTFDYRCTELSSECKQACWGC